MDLQGKIVVVTGAAHGIGKGMATRFAADGARVIRADIDETGAEAVAQDIGGHSFKCDVADEHEIQAMIESVESSIGPIDLFCANAGILTLGGAAVGFAEWLALTYADNGIRVSVLCPQAVRSEMTKGFEDSVAAIDGMLEPEDVAQACVEAIGAESFLVLPHPQVLDYMRLKTADYDRWISGMNKLNQQFAGDT